MGDLLVYKASAGSGKTYNLAMEYIKLAMLADSPTAYRNILAVTFTNKATGEMKNRILVQLFNLAYGALDGQFLQLLLEKLNAQSPAHRFSEAEVCQKARRMLHHLIHDYDHFRVETIDSFFQSLLTNLAHELELPRSYRVDLNDADVVARAVERLMEQLQDPHPGKDKEEALKLVTDYMDEQIENERGWNMVRELTSFARSNLFDTTYLKHEEQLTEAMADNGHIKLLRDFAREHAPIAEQRVKDAAREVIRLLEEVPGGAGRLYKGSNVVNDAQKVEADGVDASWGSVTQRALTDPEGMMKKAEAKNRGELMPYILELQRRLQSMVQAIADYGLTIGTAKEMLRHAAPMRLLSKVEQLMNKINEETNHVMLAKTPELFSRVVQADDAPFVFERVGTTFRHIMIDEFQDTSLMQWTNFKKLLVENMAQGNQCMLVGDVKQSIYRWRGGDWEILHGIGQDKDFFSKKEEHLNVNWRSKRAIVEYNNALFERCAPLLDQAISPDDGLPVEWRHRIEHIYSDVKQQCKPHADGGWVRLALADGKMNEEKVMEDVVAQIRNLRRAGVNDGDIGVLVRVNNEAAKLVNYIATHHSDIKISSDEAFLLTSSRSVLTLVNALRYLNDDHDTTALALLLTGLREISRDDNGPHGDGLPDKELPELMKEAEDVLPSCLTDEAERKFLQCMPLYELCQLLIARLKLACRADGSDNGQSAYLFCLLDAVLDFLADNPSDIGLFIEHWNNTLCKASAHGDHLDSVYVMTVHKSKGLSRHTILVPFCEWELTKLRNDDILWCETPKEAPYNALPMVPISPSRKSVDRTFFNTDKQQEQMQQRIDNLNLLYVAFTRAEENLLVWSRCLGTDKNKKSKDGSTPAPKTVGQLVAQASAGLLEPQESDYDEDEHEGFKVYASGQPEASASKDEGRKDEPRINPLDKPLITPIPIALQATDEEQRTQVEFRQSNPAKDFLADNELTPEEDADDTDVDTDGLSQRHYIDRGKLLHRLFEYIRTADDLPRAFQRLEMEGVTGSRKEMKKLRERMEQSMKDAEVRTWFDGSWTLFNECEILYRDRYGELHSARPDRVMMKGGLTVVVDFKFAKPTEEHRTQVARYMRFMQRMGHQNVKGYLWYVDRHRVEPVEAKAETPGR